MTPKGNVRASCSAVFKSALYARSACQGRHPISAPGLATCAIPETSHFGSFESRDTCLDKSISLRTPLEGGFGRGNGAVPTRIVNLEDLKRLLLKFDPRTLLAQFYGLEV